MGVENFITDVLTIKRNSTEGSYVKGVWVDGATNDVTVSASVQPVSGRERLLLPEAMRTKETIKVYTDVELKTMLDQLKSDRFAYNGKDYEVIIVEDWSHDTDIPHYKSICTKVDNNEDNRHE